MNPQVLLVLCSDHGNIEDLSTHTHTRNPVPLVALGPGADEVLQAAEDIADVTPAILRLHADPEFQAAIDAMSAHGAEVAAARATYGPKHPTRRAVEEAYAGARARAASHRDGADAARFVAELVRQLGDPNLTHTLTLDLSNDMGAGVLTHRNLGEEKWH